MQDDERLAMCEDDLDARILEANELRAELTEMYEWFKTEVLPVLRELLRSAEEGCNTGEVDKQYIYLSRIKGKLPMVIAKLEGE